MSDYCSNDYDKFIGKHITVIYDCGSKCKKLHCELLKYPGESSKEKFIILKSSNDTIYHINCNKIIYWVAEYDAILTENEDTYQSNIKPIESNAVAKNEELLLEKTQNEETIPIETSIPDIQLQDVEILQNDENANLCCMDFPKENTSLTPNEDTNYKKDYGCYKALEEFNHKDIYKKNFLRSPLAAFINCNFQGVYLTIYTTSTQAISGEVIFNYDYLIVLKADGKTYYINPEQITYFC